MIFLIKLKVFKKKSLAVLTAPAATTQLSVVPDERYGAILSICTARSWLAGLAAGAGAAFGRPGSGAVDVLGVGPADGLADAISTLMF